MSFSCVTDVHLCYKLSVFLSICLSVTLGYCDETAVDIETILNAWQANHSGFLCYKLRCKILPVSLSALLSNTSGYENIMILYQYLAMPQVL